MDPALASVAASELQERAPGVAPYRLAQGVRIAWPYGVDTLADMLSKRGQGTNA